MKAPKGKSVRNPVQPRGITTKEKLLDAASVLLCEKGCFQTTTNEIASRAGVSIGSFYAYFPDKDAIFLEILSRYHQKFVIAKRVLYAQPEFLRSDGRAWLRLLIESIINVHEETKELHRELTVLSYYNLRVAEIFERNRQESAQGLVDFFKIHCDLTHVDDIEATTMVIFDTISAVSDRIIRGVSNVEKERLVKAAADMIYTFLVLREEK